MRWLLLFPAVLFATIYEEETAVVEYLKEIEVTETVSGIAPIDCIYVINLDRRPERWCDMQSMLGALGLKFNRVSAVDGSTLSMESMKALAGSYEERMPKGAVGCLLSHVSILKDAKERNFNCIWSLEDDVEILEDIKEIPLLIEELSALDPDWDILYTDTNSRNRRGHGYLLSLHPMFRPDREYLPHRKYLRRRKVSPRLTKLGQRFGTYSLIFSKKGIEKVLHYFTHTFLWSPIDHDIHYIPGIREYCTSKDIVTNLRNKYPSDIDIKN